tara:strand:- start:8849 stop:9730 length:882 start_codon:yes stop_codon:yes gene_type:complete
MKTIKIQGATIKPPKSMSGSHNTPAICPKCHALVVLVGRSRAGKSVAAINLIKQMEYDRTILISPTANSNWEMLKELKVGEDDTFDDLDDPHIIQKVRDMVDKERDDYVKYHEDLKRYNDLMKDINDGKNGRHLEQYMLRFFKNGNFEKPTHKWGGRKPKIALLIDDCVQSKVFGKKLSQLCLLYRHCGSIKGEGAIGISPFIITQVYKSQGNGLPKPIRSNSTLWCLFKNYNDKEKQLVAEDLSFGMDADSFVDMWDSVCDSKEYSFLFVDTSPKSHHLSQFRRCYDEFILN